FGRTLFRALGRRPTPAFDLDTVAHQRLLPVGTSVVTGTTPERMISDTTQHPGRRLVRCEPVHSTSVPSDYDVIARKYVSTRVACLWFSPKPSRSEEHTSELQSRFDIVCRLLLVTITVSLLYV